jgi:hypothetical protein
MKKLLFSLLFIVLFTTTKAQLITTVDTSYHPIIDTSIHGYTSCKINTIAIPLNDSIENITINGTFNNHKDIENETINLNSDSGKTIQQYNFTLQGQNYTDVQNNGTEYLFEVIATYLYNTYHFRLTFK